MPSRVTATVSGSARTSAAAVTTRWTVFQSTRCAAATSDTARRAPATVSTSARSNRVVTRTRAGN